jgi:DNA-binding XRE family transcriptional regulator
VPASKPIDELRRVAADLILAQLKEITVTKAAADLGVSRQAIYGIKRGEFCPSLSLIQRACEAWNLSFSFRNLEIGKDTPVRRAKAGAVSTQLDLFEMIRCQLENQTAHIETKRMGRAVELTFRLRIGA